MRESSQPDKSFLEACAGPYQNMAATIMANADKLVLAAEPAIKASLVSSLELTSLTSRRMQAYLAVPTVLATCRTPQSLAAAQMHFWQTAAEQYTSANRHILALWTTALASPLSPTKPAPSPRPREAKHTAAKAPAASKRRQAPETPANGRWSSRGPYSTAA